MPCKTRWYIARGQPCAAVDGQMHASLPLPHPRPQSRPGPQPRAPVLDPLPRGCRPPPPRPPRFTTPTTTTKSRYWYSVYRTAPAHLLPCEHHGRRHSRREDEALPQVEVRQALLRLDGSGLICGHALVVPARGQRRRAAEGPVPARQAWGTARTTRLGSCTTNMPPLRAGAQ